MENLENVQAGQKLYVRNRYGGIIALVSKVTKTRVLADGRYFYKKDGVEVGGNVWGRCYARVATPEDVARCQLGQRRGMLSSRLMAIIKELPSMSSEQLAAFEKVVSDYDKNKNQ